MDGQGSATEGQKAEADLEMPAIHFALRLDRKGMKRNAARSAAASFFTERSLAAYLAVSDRTIRNWIRRGELPSYKLGAARRIDPADVDAFLAQRRDEAA
jgi:excisionase family DNA binding protein